MTELNQGADRLGFARQISIEAGELTLRYFQHSNLDIQRKSDDSPVTAADREAEKLLRQRIAEVFPDDAIVGEEFDDIEGTSEFQWILDPIDGTKSFICGVPLYGNLVAVAQNNRATVGVMNFPALGEQIYAETGRGAWYVHSDGSTTKASVSNCDDLGNAVFLTSEVATFYQLNREAAYFGLQSKSKLARTWGDCYGYSLVATGRADVMVDPEMSVWDAAALQPILQEAGGEFTDWSGTPTIHSGEGVGTNRHLLNQVLEILRDL